MVASDVLFSVRRVHVRDALIVAVLLFAVSALVQQAFAVGFEEGLRARELGEWINSGGRS